MSGSSHSYLGLSASSSGSPAQTGRHRAGWATWEPAGPHVTSSRASGRFPLPVTLAPFYDKAFILENKTFKHPDSLNVCALGTDPPHHLPGGESKGFTPAGVRESV